MGRASFVYAASTEWKWKEVQNTETFKKKVKQKLRDNVSW